MTEQDWNASAPGVALCRSAPARLAVLRLRRPAADTLASLEALLRTPFPRAPNRIGVGDARILWSGPDEWVVAGWEGDSDAILDAAAGAAAAHWSDVADGKTIFDVSGPRAADLLAKGCTLDFHPLGFPVDSCAQSALAQAAAMIERPGPDHFRIYIDRSLEHHLALWFRDALIEFELE